MPQDLSYILSELNARVRSLENKHNLLSEKLLVVNQNMVESYKKTSKEMRALEKDVGDLHANETAFKDALKALEKELQGIARKDDLKVLERYINMWDPLKFVTEEEVHDIIRREKEGDQPARRQRSNRTST